jgi:hypothetical protein
MHTITAPDGTTIAYDRTGTGEPLILIGGAFSYRRFPGQVKLARGCRHGSPSTVTTAVAGGTAATRRLNRSSVRSRTSPR